MSGAGALVRVAWTPGRGEPSHRSEQVTQWLCGERLEVEEEDGDGWVRAAGPDGYACWVDGGGLLRAGPGEADRWEEEADLLSLGTELRPAGRSAVPRFLPWGARVAAAARDGGVRLPDGRTVEPTDPDRLVAREACAQRFPPRADALLATAAGWAGVPYQWGGRTRAGADCSGYLQAIFGLHGRPLPRDSGLQAGADAPVWRRGGAEDAGSRRRGAGSAGSDPPPETAVDELLAPSRGLLRPGDLLFFGSCAEASRDFGSHAEGSPDFGSHAEAITHVGVCAEAPVILHAAAGRGQVTRDDLTADDPLMERLRERLVAVTRPLAREGGAG